MQIVPATTELLKRFYGVPPVRSQRAVVAMRGDDVVGVAGVFLAEAGQVMFSDLTDEVRKSKRTIIRGIREVQKLAKPSMPVYAEADEEIEGSEKLLEHMGFVHYRDRIYRWQASSRP
jgi:hypothetical protein